MRKFSVLRDVTSPDSRSTLQIHSEPVKKSEDPVARFASRTDKPEAYPTIFRPFALTG